MFDREIPILIGNHERPPVGSRLGASSWNFIRLSMIWLVYALQFAVIFAIAASVTVGARAFGALIPLVLVIAFPASIMTVVEVFLIRRRRGSRGR